MKLLFLCVATALAGDATLRALSGANDVVMVGGATALSKASGSADLHALPISLVESVEDTDTVLQLEAKAGKDAEIVFVDDGGGNRVALVKPHNKAELHLQGGRLMIDGKDVAEAWTDLAAANERIQELEAQLAQCSTAAPEASEAEWVDMSGYATSESSSWYDNNHGVANTVLSHGGSGQHGGDEVFWQADWNAKQDQWVEYDAPEAVQVNEFRYQPVYWNGPGTEPKTMFLYVDGTRYGPFDGASVKTLSSPCLDNFKPGFGDGQCLDLPFQSFPLAQAVTGQKFRLLIVNSWGYEDPSSPNNLPAIKRFGLGYRAPATTTTAAPDPKTKCDGYLQYVVDAEGNKHYCPPPPAAFPAHGTVTTVPHACDTSVGPASLTRDCVMEFNGVDTRYFEAAKDVVYNRAAGSTVGQGDVWVQMKIKADASRASGTLFDMGSDEQHVRLEYFTRADGETYVGLRSKGGSGTSEVWNRLSAGDWHWVHATKSEGQLRLQVDGKLSTLADASGSFDWSTFQKDCTKCGSDERLQDCINVGARATTGAFDRAEQAYNFFKGQITEFAMGNQVGAAATVETPLSQCADQGNSCQAGPSSGGGHWVSPSMISDYPTQITGCSSN